MNQNNSFLLESLGKCLKCVQWRASGAEPSLADAIKMRKLLSTALNGLILYSKSALPHFPGVLRPCDLLVIRADFVQPNTAVRRKDEEELHQFTRSVQELALSHVRDVKSLEQQHQVAKVLLRYPRTMSLTHPVFI